MEIEELKNLFRRYGFKPNFTYGQNFLLEDSVLDEIVKAANVTSADAVLEIGPGIGNLTRKLLQNAGFVLSVEKDPKFLPILKALKKDYKNNFRFEIADALEFDFQSYISNLTSKIQYKVVANIPYYITGKILQMLLSAKHKPESITILTQKEVAQNLSAKAGDLGILAISVQLYGQPQLVKIVPAESFYPAPKVDSAIIHIPVSKKPKYKITDEKKFFKIVKACFLGKRKQIHNTLENNLGLNKIQVEEILTELKIKPAVRPQELSIEDWVKLSDKVELF